MILKSCFKDLYHCSPCYFRDISIVRSFSDLVTFAGSNFGRSCFILPVSKAFRLFSLSCQKLKTTIFFQSSNKFISQSNLSIWKHSLRLNVIHIRYQGNCEVKEIIPDDQKNRQNSFIKSVFCLPPQAHIKRTFTTVISRSIFKGRYDLAERCSLQPMGNGLPQNTFAPLRQPFTGYNKDMS